MTKIPFEKDIACQNDLCQKCIPSPSGIGHGTCCNSTWSCVYDNVFRDHLCLPPHPWICSPEHKPKVVSDHLPRMGDMRMTPFGLFHKDCVFTHPDGAHIEPSDSGTKVTYPDGSTHHIPRNQMCEDTWVPTERIQKLHQLSTDIEPLHGWFEYTYETVDPTSFNFFAANYTVPKAPSNSGSNLLYYFIGMENLGTQNPLTILQPVLTWYQGAWTMSSWNCCPNGQTHQAGPLTNIPTGGKLYGSVKSSSGTDTIISSYPGATPIELKVANNAGDGARVWDWVDATLEVYNVDTCDELSPTGMVMEDLVFGKETGSNFSPVKLNWEFSNRDECAYTVNVQEDGAVYIGPKQ